MRRWMLTAVGAGATSISFGVTRSEIMAREDNGFSLLDSEGETTERFDEALRVGRPLMKNPDICGHASTPSAKVGLIVHEANYDFTSSHAKTDQHLIYSIRGWYKLLWELGIPVDSIPIANIVDGSEHVYKALILPFPLWLSQKSAERLEKYVVRGGHFISEAAPGRMDEYGLCRRDE
jgi:beta-galactosidase